MAQAASNDSKHQLHTVAVKNAEARQGQQGVLVARDFGRDDWKKQFPKSAGYDYYDDFADKYDSWPFAWEPMWYRSDQTYHLKYKRASGAPAVQNAPQAISRRVFNCWNGLPRMRFDESDGKYYISKNGQYSEVADGKNFSWRLAGLTIDAFHDEMNANNGFFVEHNGMISTWNNSQMDLLPKDIIRFGPPEEGKQYYIDKEGKTIPYWALREGDEFDKGRKDTRLATGVFKVNPKSAKQWGYHAVVEHGGAKGEQIYITLVPEGEIPMQ
jgi:hypothetical protein